MEYNEAASKRNTFQSTACNILTSLGGASPITTPSVTESVTNSHNVATSTTTVTAGKIVQYICNTSSP